MKRLLFSLLGVAVLNGCATGLIRTAGMTAYDGVSAEYPGEARLLAENAAASDGSITGLKTPKVEKGDGEDAVFLEKLYLIGQVVDVLLALFRNGK